MARKQFTALFAEILVPPTVAVTIVTSDKMTGRGIKVEWSEALNDRVDCPQKAGNLTIAVADKGGLWLDASDPDVRKTKSSSGDKVTYAHRSHMPGEDLTVTVAPSGVPIWVGGLGPVSAP